VNRAFRSSRDRKNRRHAPSRLQLEPLEQRLLLATFFVNSTGDETDVNPGDGICETVAAGGVCTLRAAIQETNALANSPAGTPDEIRFAIPANDPRHFYYLDNGNGQANGSVNNSPSFLIATTAADDLSLPADKDPDWPHSWWSIRITQNGGPNNAILPTVTDPVRIDGTTQSGAQENTNPAPQGLNSVLRIEIDVAGFSNFNAGGDNDAFLVTGGGSTLRGLAINNAIGGGIALVDNGANVVEGNILGTDVSGTVPFLGNNTFGVVVVNSANRIGGTAPAARNLIAANSLDGIGIFVASGNLVQGNLIGTRLDGVTPFGNGGNGVMVAGSQDETIGATNNTIGGTASGAANTIAFNGSAGVAIRRTPDIGNAVLGNTIYSNGGLGINLGFDGVTANDVPPGTVPPDTDSGPNNLQNFPVLTAVTRNPNDTMIAGTLTSTPSATFRVEFFVSTVSDGEGRQFLGSLDAATDVNGSVSFLATVPATAPGFCSYTATATRTSTNDTSEFSTPFDLPVSQLVVTTTADVVAADCQISLREAITFANGNAGLDTITFNIPSIDAGRDPATGVFSIRPTSGLPTSTGPIVIDGYSQPGSARATAATNATLLIELNGAGAGAGADGLRINGGGSTIEGLVINRFVRFEPVAGTPSGGSAIVLSAVGNNVVEGNFVGTNAAGTAALGNGFSGIEINVSSNNRIGGTSPGARNIISANRVGVALNESPATGNMIQGNFIGTDVSGTLPLGNSLEGVRIGPPLEPGGGILIGGPAQTPLNNLIGGTAAGAGNIIAFNGTQGILVNDDNTGSPTGNSILSNSIFSNGSLPIDLAAFGSAVITPNDSGDGDDGPNRLQNSAVLTSATLTGGSVAIEGTLNSTAATNFRVEFFANSIPNFAFFPGGRTFIGSTNVTTNAGGNATLSVSFPSATDVITATTTRLDDMGNPFDTSEFSQVSGSANPSFAVGDVFLGVGNEMIQWRRADGSPVRLLDYDPNPLGLLRANPEDTTGMAFDRDDNLYATTFVLREVKRFNSRGELLPGEFGSGFGDFPESIVFDAAGNAYVGAVDGDEDVVKLSPAGAELDRFNVATEERGSDWVDLAADQRTLFYTSEGPNVKRYDVVSDQQLADFASGLSTPPTGKGTRALRLLACGGLLVANSENIVRLDGAGTVIQTYDAPGEDRWFALNLDSDGTSFWSAGQFTGNVYKFDIATGAILLTFNTGAVFHVASSAVAGITVFGERTAASAGLALTKTDSVDPVAPGSDLAYTITITNNSCNDFTGVALTDTLPAGVTFVSTSAGSFSAATNSVTANLGTLAIDGRATVTIVVRPTAAQAGTTLSNTATVTAVEPDPVTANNTDTETTRVVAGAPACDLAVTTTADVINSGDAVNSLREAVICANATPGADTISVPAGTYTLTIAGTGENVAATGDLDITDDLTIQGATGDPSDVIIQAGTTGPNLLNGTPGNGIDRVFDIVGAIDVNFAAVTIRHGALTGLGLDPSGGGINLPAGGSAASPAKTVTITDSVITANHANAAGGGVADRFGNTSLVVTRTSISGNQTRDDGGGVFHGPAGGSLSVTDSTVDGNSSDDDGGGIRTDFGADALTVVRSTISRDTAGGDGGGISFTTNDFLTLINSTISSNTSGNFGGGIDFPPEIQIDASLLNSTITENATTIQGGGFNNEGSGTVQLKNTIVAANRLTGGNSSASPGSDVFGAFSSQGNNLIGNSDGSTGFGVGDLSGSPSSPLGPQLANLANNGGLTETHLPQVGSPAIDTGNNSGAPATDQRGIARPQPSGGTVDIGAVEVQEVVERMARLGGQKFLDRDADGVHDGDEPGIPDWEVRLLADTDSDGVPDTVIAVASTDPSGNYRFDVTVPGVYLVQEVIPSTDRFLLVAVSDFDRDRIERFNAQTGAFVDVFVATGVGGLENPRGILIGPDHNLHVNNTGNNSILRYDASTGAFIDEFVNSGSGGLDGPINATIGADGNLYVASIATNSVLRFNGATGQFIDEFVAPGSG